MMQRWRGGGTLELARALAIGRSANHSFGNNRLHTLHTKDTREPAKNCPEWGCSLGPDVVHLRCQAGRRRLYRAPLLCPNRDQRDDPFPFSPRLLRQSREHLALPQSPRLQISAGTRWYPGALQGDPDHVVPNFARPRWEHFLLHTCPT